MMSSKYVKYILILILIIIILLNPISFSKLYKLSNNIINNNIHRNTIRENLENQDNNKYIQPNLQNDPLYLTKVNSADITYLKKQMDGLSDLNLQIAKLNKEVQSNSAAIQSLNKSLRNTANNATLDKKTTQRLANSSSMSVDYSKMN